MINRKKIEEEMREQGLVPTKDRILVMKKVLEHHLTSDAERWKILTFFLKFIKEIDNKFDVEEFFKDLKDLTEQYFDKNGRAIGNGWE